MIQIGPIEKLGTVWWFEFFDLPEEQQESFKKKIVEIMDDFESNYSRFNSRSLLSVLNREKVLADPPEELVGMLQIATRAYRETQGVFNIAVGDYLEKTGYDKEYSFVSQQTTQIPELTKALSCTKNEVQLRSNVKIDFGGFGKGYLIDKLANMFQEECGLRYFLINGGGDMYVTSDHGEAIEIGLQDPETQTIVGKTHLLGQAFASSSPVLRTWTDQDGVTHDHLVKTTNNTQEKKTSYVVALTAVQADIWATTLSIDMSVLTPNTVQIIKL